MEPLNPQPPFVWPEPRAIEGMLSYAYQPPYDELAQQSCSVFGIVSGITITGVAVLERWFETNLDLKARLIVMVYPACSTRQADLSRLIELVGRYADRISVRLRPLGLTTDRATNALCFLGSISDTVTVVTGPTEDLGLDPRQGGHVNFVFHADPPLIEAYTRYFDWLWVNSQEITTEGVALIPELVRPQGTDEAAQLWQAYMSQCLDAASTDSSPQAVAKVDAATGEVTLQANNGEEFQSPTEELGLPKLDELAEKIARLYSKGALVSIDKLSRIPPLDAPLNPSLFGDDPELQRGNVTRKVSMRVSIIDESPLKEITKRTKGLRTLLSKFTFGLADNMRWMPTTATALFESELKRLNEQGQKLISSLLNGDVDAFVKAKRDALVKDLNGMCMQLGRPGQVTEDVITHVIDNLKDRLTKAQSANFMPKLSYSRVTFAGTSNNFVSPWGQAFSLLADVIAFPRKALTDGFFFRGLKVPEDDLIEAMNIADDALCNDLRARNIRDRCKAELDLLSKIEKASIESRDRCELACRILSGDPIDAIDKTLEEKKSR